MLRVAFAACVLTLVSVSMGNAALAQWDSPWDDDRSFRRYPQPYPYPNPYYRQPSYGFPREWGFDDERPRRPLPGSIGPTSRSGGLRPQIASVAPARIVFPSAYEPGSIVIDHQGRQLILVQSRTQALRYPISVGREGFSWAGTERISRVVDWPDWHPPADMRARDPSLPVHMSGGLKNPLGVKALYLGKTLYRIHGTNDARSIGRAASSGCFRMLNGHVVDLASRVGVGTAVTVVRRLPPDLARIVAAQARGEVVRAPPPAVLPPAVRPPAVKTPPVRAPGETEPLEEGPAGEGNGGRERGT